MSVELFKKDDDKRLRRRGIVHGWLKPFLFAAALTFLAVLASHGAEDAPKKADYVDPVTGMEFVFVKGGDVVLETIWCAHYEGKLVSEKAVVNDFYIGKYEVTQAQWEKVMGSRRFWSTGKNLPADIISWEDGVNFAAKLSAVTGKKYRLPTEAEWEYAARSGGKDEVWSGTSNESELTDYAWLKSNSKGSSHPVGMKKPNGLGLHDMTGNVAERILETTDETEGRWIFFHETDNSKLNGAPGRYAWARGGSWYTEPNYSKTMCRDFDILFRTVSYEDYGFRLVMTIEGSAK